MVELPQTLALAQAAVASAARYVETLIMVSVEASTCKVLEGLSYTYIDFLNHSTTIRRNRAQARRRDTQTKTISSRKDPLEAIYELPPHVVFAEAAAIRTPKVYAVEK